MRQFNTESIPLSTVPVGKIFKTELAIDDPLPTDPTYIVEDREEAPRNITVIKIARGKKETTTLPGATRVCVAVE